MSDKKDAEGLPLIYKIIKFPNYDSDQILISNGFKSNS